MEILGPAIREITKCLPVPFLREIGYLLCYKRNARVLKTRVEELERKRNDTESLVDAAKRNLEEPTEEVLGWIESANGMIEEARMIDQEVREKGWCLMGWCPDLWSLYKLGRKAVEKRVDVVDLCTRGHFERVAMNRRQPSIEPLPTGFIENFASFELALNNVMDALHDGKCKIIGVYGMGGVGKTTLVTKLQNQLQGKQLFKKVIMVTVSTHPDLKKIQERIAERLDLKLESDSSERSRASRLFQRLKQDESVLIILDDLWERLELQDVGIPSAEEHPGCRIIVTTRSVKVCGSMECQAKIKVSVLSKEDSWNLFKSKAGDVDSLSSLGNVPKKVAEECGGLPLALVTVGLALRDKQDPNVWNNALFELERSAPTSIEGMEPKVFSSIKLSFDHLEGEEIKMCFLFCCLFPEDHNIDVKTLIRYVIGEGIIGGMNMKEASLRGHTLVDKLKDSCLLLSGDMKGTVKMHDVVRDVAISIASGDAHKFFARARAGLREWPEVDIGEYKRISLMENTIQRLPDPVGCPKLLTLLLQSHEGVREISDKFFEGMNALLVLDLSCTAISSIPQSLSCLENLRLLNLRSRRHLRDVSLVGRLRTLEMLDLSYTSISKLPEEIGELAKLKILDLSYASKLAVVPPNVISRLRCLEELYMFRSFGGWEVEGKGDGSKANWAEVAGLTRLSILQVKIDNVDCVAQDVPCSWTNLLDDFYMVVGSIEESGGRFLRKRNLFIKNANMTSKWVNAMMKQAENLHLYNCEGFKTLTQLGTKRFQSLGFLTITDCDDLEFVQSGDEMNGNVLQNLEGLYLSDLKNLKSLSDGTLGNLESLKEVQVSNCRKLKNLFSSVSIRGFCQLKSINVQDCHEMEEIIVCEEEEVEMNFLPRLEQLDLYRLPQLMTIVKGQIPRRSFENLEILKVGYCDGMVNLFSAILATRMEKLRILEVWKCEEMEEIISMEGTVNESSLLPRLERLSLHFLSKLTSICRGVLAWPSLKMITMLECPSLKKLPLGVQSAPKLQLIRGTSNWWEELQWEHQEVKSRISPLLRKISRSGI